MPACFFLKKNSKKSIEIFENHLAKCFLYGIIYTSKGERITQTTAEGEIIMEYEARLYAAEWTNGSGWNCGSGFNVTGDEVESWDISEGDLDSWKQLFKDRDRSLFDYVIDGLNDRDDDYDEDPDDEEGDTKWTMQLVEIDDDDNEKVIAQTSIWESELFSEDNEDN